MKYNVLSWQWFFCIGTSSVRSMLHYSFLKCSNNIFDSLKCVFIFGGTLYLFGTIWDVPQFSWAPSGKNSLENHDILLPYRGRGHYAKKNREKSKKYDTSSIDVSLWKFCKPHPIYFRNMHSWVVVLHILYSEVTFLKQISGRFFELLLWRISGASEEMKETGFSQKNLRRIWILLMYSMPGLSWALAYFPFRTQILRPLEKLYVPVGVEVQLVYNMAQGSPANVIISWGDEMTDSSFIPGELSNSKKIMHE